MFSVKFTLTIVFYPKSNKDEAGQEIAQELNNRPLAKVFHGMIKSYLFLELATVVKRSLSEIAVRQHSRSETASK